MRVLILGGTAFLGRVLARQAVEGGAEVTCVARGTAPAADGIRLIRADRDHDDALAPFANDAWDAIIDVTRQPGHARRAARDLRAHHWILISSGNVYAAFDRPEQREDSPLLAPLAEDTMGDMSRYGEAKVACEEAFRGGRDPSGKVATSTIIRAGLIGGYGDWSGRTGYYPWRFAHPTGPDVLAPPDPTFPVALIDVEDLAAWTLHCARHRTHGTFNATGPTTTLECFLDTSRSVADSDAVTRHVSAPALEAAGVGAWMGPASLPLWIDDQEWRWFATLDTSAARAAGLRTRPLAETLQAALDYEHVRDQPRATGLTDEEETRLRASLG